MGSDKVGEDELYEKFHSEGKLSQSMGYREMGQCGSVKSEKPKVVKKKAKASAKVPAKSKELPQVEVKSDGSATHANKTGQKQVDAMDADSFLQSLALEEGLHFDAYSGKRSRLEWEKLFVGMAGKIYSRQV